MIADVIDLEERRLRRLFIPNGEPLSPLEALRVVAQLLQLQAGEGDGSDAEPC